MLLEVKLAKRRCVAAPEHGAVPLSGLSKAAPASVVGMTGDDEVARRLFDLGFQPGLTVELLRRAPLGDPMLFDIAGNQIALRRAEAARVLVAR